MKIKDIDTSTIDGKMTVMELFSEGHTLLVRDKLKTDSHWRVNTNPIWDWNSLQYAIAEGPQEVWLVRDDSGYYKKHPFLVKEEAEEFAREMYAISCMEHHVIRFVEISE
jgi:hypothetical protein